MPDQPNNHFILSGGTNDSMLGKSSIQQDQNMTPCREAAKERKAYLYDKAMDDEELAYAEGFSECLSMWQAAKADTAEAWKEELRLSHFAELMDDLQAKTNEVKRLLILLSKIDKGYCGVGDFEGTGEHVSGLIYDIRQALSNTGNAQNLYTSPEPVKESAISLHDTDNAVEG